MIRKDEENEDRKKEKKKKEEGRDLIITSHDVFQTLRFQSNSNGEIFGTERDKKREGGRGREGRGRGGKERREGEESEGG